MPSTPNRVRIESVAWSDVLPALRLVSSFRMALQPGKLLVALVAVVLLHLSGLLLDTMWGTPVAGGLNAEDQGVYETVLQQEAVGFELLIRSALSLELGLGERNVGIVDALHHMVVGVPAWAFGEYPGFTLIYGVFALLVLAVVGGLVCRMAATRACGGELTPLPRAVRFVMKRGPWYVLTPLMPTLLILLLAGLLMLAGLVLFNLPGLDVVGALIYGGLLLMGFVISLVAVLLVFALFLMMPALSVEGTDGFDAIARSFNYVLFRPWQYAGYFVAAVVYAAVVYLLVTAFVGLTLEATESFVGVGAFAEVYPAEFGELTRYEAIEAQAWAGPEMDGGPDEYSVTVGPAGWIVRRWIDLLFAIAGAVMLSVVFCLQTHVYLLLRRSADGTPLTECAADDEIDPWSSPADMVDPEAQAIVAAGPSGAGPSDPPTTQPD